MGAHTIENRLSGTLKRQEVRAEFEQWRENDREEYGTDAYNGSWSTIPELKFEDTKVFSNYVDAHGYAMDRAEKWSHAVAVQYFDRNVKSKIEKPPTRAELKFNSEMDRIAAELVKVQAKMTSASDDERSWFDEKTQEFITCKECGSKLASRFVKEKSRPPNKIRCLVCNESLTRASYKKISEAQTLKFNALVSERELLQKERKEFIESQPADPEQLRWLVLGWAAS